MMKKYIKKDFFLLYEEIKCAETVCWGRERRM